MFFITIFINKKISSSIISSPAAYLLSLCFCHTLPVSKRSGLRQEEKTPEIMKNILVISALYNYIIYSDFI